ncbi:hypothetical protein [Thermodesulfatator autotrophicus]|uniref:Uncharacterized protein n=1 Tax=Thermodesulfatator autotrophicus TaxID=1795632 RepID=A0A177E605_9BACT|nr:hypothetical protein [Thermodesulfatator autotrophicus]OAG27387.1 hypothetical protein TH606_07250 [Thermodesulfatator autotrophicus]
MEPFKFFFLDSFFHPRPEGFLFVVDRFKAFAIGSVFVLLGLSGLLMTPKFGFGLPFLSILYGALHFPLALKNKAFISSKYLELSGLYSRKIIPLNRIDFFFLDSLKRSFFLGCQLKNKKRYILAAFRPPGGEVTAYRVVDELEKLKIPFRDETLWEISMANSSLQDKFHLLSQRKALLKSCFREMPKDFLIFGAFFSLFALFIAFILPPEAPKPIKVGFPTFALVMALLSFLTLGKDAFISWEIELLGGRIFIKKLLFGSFILSTHQITRQEILRTIPRPYIYRPARYTDFTKGLTFRIITKQGVFSLGALLSRKDIERLNSFIKNF